MLNNFEKTIEKFDQLAIRTRILITFIFFMLIFFFFDLFWFSINESAISKQQQQLLIVKKQNRELLQMQNNFNAGIARGRIDPKIILLKSTNKELLSVEKQLKEKTVNLVQPEDMANIIKDIISATNNLKLQRLMKGRTVEISSNSHTSKKPIESEKIKLYKHSMEIVLNGQYTATMKFLTHLEKMEKKFSFDSFDYIVEQYPNAKIKLTVSTLSLQKEWIGG
jgi:MSHA biogenesis protein MshJ